MGGGTNLEGGARPADKRALDALHDRIGFFCDDTRDCIKGNVFDAGNAGYVNGAPQHGYEVLHSHRRVARRRSTASRPQRRPGRWCSTSPPTTT